MVRLGKSLLNETITSSSTANHRSSNRQQSFVTASSTYSSKNTAIPDSILIPLLAQKSYHLPNLTWKEDWIQWMRNNHIVFGICFCHKLHPIEWWERIIVLLGSMSFALIAINIYYVLWDLDHLVNSENSGNYDSTAGFDPQREVFYFSLFGATHIITEGTIVLWTFGGILNAVFDFCVWQTSACACCHPGGRCYDRCGFCSRRCNDLGSYILVPIILAVMTLAVYSSYLRFHMNDEDDADTSAQTDDVYNVVTGGMLGQFSFLVKYFVELFLSWFVYFPILGTIMFSGILGCGGRLPILGGRPRDKAKIEKELSELNYRLERDSV
ncbi:hypothetical protein IV203_012596 [Nitzschia inconspicua]|uniref:Uncharacterized protein n=1 Tax=Nitzschia inconspicua TaxID=303405 RepID=A0A9K3KU27_9STRA|nr:hypothetical protein IV203_012596 [Nitzschia inconspicua]